ncbi:hypothetical protein D3C84_822870 [compost metagenome]
MITAHVETCLRLFADIAKASIALTFHPALTHVSAISYASDHPSYAFEFAVSTADGANGHAEAVGQQPMRRQFAAGLDHAFNDRFFHGVRQALVLHAQSVDEPVAED